MLRLIVGTILGVTLAGSATAQAVAAISKAQGTGASARAVDARISVAFDNTPLDQAVRAVAQKAGVAVLFSSSMLPVKKVNYKATDIAPATVLAELLRGTGVRVDRNADASFVLVRAAAKVVGKAQGIVVGKVTDVKNGKGINGATVSVDNDTRGVLTGNDGSFRLTGVSAGTHTITVRLVGYAKQIKSITVAEGATVTVDLQLESSASVLDQVVVTGTVVQTELKAVPNAITVVTAKQIEERGITRIDQLFRGEIPGLFALNQGSSDVLNQTFMFSRGATAISSASAGTRGSNTNPIKTYVDGIEVANTAYLSQIDPRSIERIEILTGPQASTIYGSNALNGVMQIFTKRGSGSRPQLSLSLLSAWTQNNFSSALAPQHDYSAQLSGNEGRLSYNAGGSWQYTAPWTPSRRSVQTSMFGGTRLDQPTPLGNVTVDVSIRRSNVKNYMDGSTDQTLTSFRESGWYRTNATAGLAPLLVYAVSGQTLGLTVGHSPKSWWSHELVVGQDFSDGSLWTRAASYNFPDDSSISIESNPQTRRSLSYSTTARTQLVFGTQLTVTAGGDSWQHLNSYVAVSDIRSLTGTLTGSTFIQRTPDHNTGAFVQSQFSIMDRLFLTYGLRAEWNPAFGSEAEPNYAPRYGIAYTQELGTITTKLRASYGRSTRPPTAGFKVNRTIVQQGGGLDEILVPIFGLFDYSLANPLLAPEHQQGGEGGVEMYFGTRGSLVVTRYNQTVDNLINNVKIDSARSLAPNPTFFGVTCAQVNTIYCLGQDTDGYAYTSQYQYLNIGTIRNQGWELQGSVNTGPFTTKGTYSWTKSRVIGINPLYRAQFPANRFPLYQPGASFSYLAEHTWALGVNYTRARTTMGLNISGIGKVKSTENEFAGNYISAQIRLPQNRQRFRTAGYVSINPAYAMADFTATQRFSSKIDGVLQVRNLADKYKVDDYAASASMGRQTKLGARVRF